MPAAYSYDVRKKAIQALDEGKSRTEVARMFKIGRVTLDLFQNSLRKLKIVNSSNQIESQAETFSSISIAICNDFKSLK